MTGRHRVLAPGRPAARRLACALALATAALGPGCAHHQLSFSTVLTANTHQTIVFGMVLDNIAMFAAQPDTMPWHVRVRDGTVQITDKLGIGQQGGGFSTFSNGRFGIETYGPQGSRQVALQWGTDAVGDPIQLYALQSAYRRVLGLPPLPEPNFLTEARRARRRGVGNNNSDEPEPLDDNDPETRPGAGSVEISRYGEVPLGWFCVGSKKDVPRDAAFVGHHGDTYVWVMPRGVGGLTRFTWLVLAIVKLEAAPDGGNAKEGGLMFTP
jgi:hypothetical protein